MVLSGSGRGHAKDSFLDLPWDVVAWAKVLASPWIYGWTLSKLGPQLSQEAHPKERAFVDESGPCWAGNSQLCPALEMEPLPPERLEDPGVSLLAHLGCPSCRHLSVQRGPGWPARNAPIPEHSPVSGTERPWERRGIRMEWGVVAAGQPTLSSPACEMPRKASRISAPRS